MEASEGVGNDEKSISKRIIMLSATTIIDKCMKLVEGEAHNIDS